MSLGATRSPPPPTRDNEPPLVPKNVSAYNERLAEIMIDRFRDEYMPKGLWMAIVSIYIEDLDSDFDPLNLNQEEFKEYIVESIRDIILIYHDWIDTDHDIQYRSFLSFIYGESSLDLYGNSWINPYYQCMRDMRNYFREVSNKLGIELDILMRITLLITWINNNPIYLIYGKREKKSYMSDTMSSLYILMSLSEYPNNNNCEQMFRDLGNYPNERINNFGTYVLGLSPEFSVIEIPYKHRSIF